MFFLLIVLFDSRSYVHSWLRIGIYDSIRSPFLGAAALGTRGRFGLIDFVAVDGGSGGFWSLAGRCADHGWSDILLSFLGRFNIFDIFEVSCR